MEPAKLIDSHAHLDMKDFKNDRREVIERAFDGGVSHIISVGTDAASSRTALLLAKEFEYVHATVGFHPHNAADCCMEDLKALADMASDPDVVAWGEIGLDYYRNYSPRDIQLEMFQRQLEMAADLGMPVVIHDREAHDDVRKSVFKMGKGEKKGVIHCYSGDIDLAREYISRGYFISIPGTVTYKNAATVRKVAAWIPQDRLLIETDAPFLAPAPKRGQRNEPLFVKYTAIEIARIRKTEFENIAHATAQNAKDLFGIV